MLGGGVVHFGLSQVDDGALAQISELPGVREASLVREPVAPPLAEGEEVEASEKAPVESGVLVKVLAENSQEAVICVLGFLNERDLTLTSLEILDPNLESVFLHLTGKRLRE
jgi:ABC-2 type transport system ATP-binding protein